MIKKFVVITGSNRRNGIGFSLVQTFGDNEWSVVGTYRNSKTAKPLREYAKENKHIYAMQLDVADNRSVLSFREELREYTDRVAILINNAGMPSTSGTIATAPIESLEKQMQVHAIGPIRVTKALLPFLRGTAATPTLVAVITSVLGQIAHVGAGHTYYAPCKTAANALVRQMGSELRNQGISMFSLHPGWVATDIGGSFAPVSPIQSARGIYQVITSSEIRDAVTFRDFQGKHLEW